MYNVALIASVIAHEGEEAAEKWLMGVRDNLARKPQGNDRAQAKGIHEGVCDVAISNHYYMGKMATNEKKPEQKDWANAVDVQFLDQNGRGNHVNISGAAVIKGAKNPRQRGGPSRVSRQRRGAEHVRHRQFRVPGQGGNQDARSRRVLGRIQGGHVVSAGHRQPSNRRDQARGQGRVSMPDLRAEPREFASIEGRSLPGFAPELSRRPGLLAGSQRQQVIVPVGALRTRQHG